MTRAIHEIQSEAMRLTQVKVLGAIESEDWVALSHLADQLKELAARGLYHASQSRLSEITQFALNGHCERESR